MIPVDLIGIPSSCDAPIGIDHTEFIDRRWTRSVPELRDPDPPLPKQVRAAAHHEAPVWTSPALRQVMEMVGFVAGTDSTVLVRGETGTGKELIAQLIHTRSGRKDKALVRLDCTTIPANLAESELFGHEKGAFTGALWRKLGRFELADGGTLFIDEIGELPLDLQAKLLRVLQEGEFERVGVPTRSRSMCA